MIPINTASINLNPQFKLIDMAYNCQLFNSSIISKDHYVCIKKILHEILQQDDML